MHYTFTTATAANSTANFNRAKVGNSGHANMIIVREPNNDQATNTKDHATNYHKHNIVNTNYKASHDTSKKQKILNHARC